MEPVKKLSDAELISQSLAGQKAGERIEWLYRTYGERLVASSSFGLQAAVMLQLISRHAPKVPVVFVDTGYLFPETYQYIEELQDKLNVDLRVYQPVLTAARQEALYGKLWQQGEEGNKKYSLINKVEPMNRAILEVGGDIWLSGLRKSQSSTRANRAFAEQQSGTTKVYPILDWSDEQVADYYTEKQLPKHPLAAKGYVTMGDTHSTIPLEEGMTAEETRYGGNKYECGLHLNSGEVDFQI